MITLFKLSFIFVHKKSKKQIKKKKKKAGTKFVLLSLSKHSIGLFMKTYLHRPNQNSKISCT